LVPTQNPRDLTPVEFEQFVRDLLDQKGMGLEEYHSAHLEKIEANDGVFEFDVTARFRALGSEFLVVVECKRWKAPIEREQVQALEQKRQSVHAQKAMLFSTSNFRKGAIGFAKAHGIALIVVEKHDLFWEYSRCLGPDFASEPFVHARVFAPEDDSRASHLLVAPGPHLYRSFLLAFIYGNTDED